MTGWWQRLRQRPFELELLISAGLLLFAGLGAVIVGRGEPVQWVDLAIAAAFIGLFLSMSLALALRGWGEDPIMLPLAAFLASISMIMTRRLEPDLALRYGDLYGSIALKQVIWVLLGAIVLGIVCFVPWRMRWLKHYRYSWLLLGLGLVAIAAVFGVERNGARLWLDFGPFQFQPVEMLKILLVVYLATYLDARRDLLERGAFRIGRLALPPLPYLLPLGAMWGLTIALIIIQKDLGAALLFFVIFLAMLYLVTRRVSYMMAGLLAFAVGAAALYPIFGHVRVRFDAWNNPWADPIGGGYQIIQSLYALASGGWAGTGLGMGDPTAVPESHTDFMFTSIAEELGFVGAFGILICYGLLALRGYQIAIQARDGFAQLLAAGLTTAVVAQALIITAGTTNLIPLTGITLPFVSYGGSAMLINFAMIGLLLRISAHAAPAQLS
ncbi:MAG TPA: FtsW/RodA/SpoVE family cell cycle protein [Roseiflexaceae bacterium]|nr:FtsW/RodA/SpoVE family cell cycle protein [Roseiflexaceae bacterium]HMP43297.1 FtsW/RodA/SpoVE family cell cycle protein [Roseiflexaceae bacterium]